MFTYVQQNFVQICSFLAHEFYPGEEVKQTLKPIDFFHLLRERFKSIKKTCTAYKRLLILLN